MTVKYVNIYGLGTRLEMKTLFKKSVVDYRIAIPSSVALAMKGIVTKKLRRSMIKVHSN